jgi:serine protease Do
MKHRLVVILTGIVIAAAVGANVVLAQKSDAPAVWHAETPSGDQVIVASGPEHVEKRVIRLGGDEASWLGVSVSDVNSEKAKELKLSGEYGTIVEDVRDDSPAAKAGLKKGDVILQFAGEKVRSAANLRRLVRETPAGRTVSIEVSRNGSTQKLTAKIAEAPEMKWFSQFEGPHVEIPDVHVPDLDFNVIFADGPRLGVSADELTPQLADYFGVKQGKGVLVREVEDGTPAQKAGLKAGDVIVKAGDDAIASVLDLRKALRKNPSEKRQVILTIVRDRKEQTVSVQLEPEKQILGPQEVSELQGRIINPESMRILKDQLRAHTEELKNNSELMRLQSEKVKEEVQRSVQQYRKDMEKYKKEYRQEIEQFSKNLQKQILERVQEPI